MRPRARNSLIDQASVRLFRSTRKAQGQQRRPVDVTPGAGKRCGNFRRHRALDQLVEDQAGSLCAITKSEILCSRPAGYTFATGRRIVKAGPDALKVHRGWSVVTMMNPPRRQVLPSSARYGSSERARQPEMTRSKDEPGRGNRKQSAQTNAIRSALGWAPARPIIAKEKIRTDHSRTRARKAHRGAAGSVPTSAQSTTPAPLPSYG